MAPSSSSTKQRGAGDAPSPSDLEGYLPMRELAARSGVSAATIKHYVREGLLGDGNDIIRTSRNMAYYPPAYVERLVLIKRLQEDCFMPLRVIRETLNDPARASKIGQIEGRLLDHVHQLLGTERLSMQEAADRYGFPIEALERLAELDVIGDGRDGYGNDDLAILQAIARFRASGYNEHLGFTVYDTLRYRDALAPLVQEEVSTYLERVASQVDVDEAVQIITAGWEVIDDLVAAMRGRMALVELQRQRDALLG